MAVRTRGPFEPVRPGLTAREHYDRLAESGHGRNDPPILQAFMARWDGPPFREALGDLRGKDVLEVGIGYGRIARQVLNAGCRRLTGLDISSRTLEAAAADLSEFPNLELVLADVVDFVRPASFDLAFSVLTFMHIEDKQLALQHIFDSLRDGGRLVLSIDDASDTLDFGDWNVDLYPWNPEQYAELLINIGFEIDPLVPLIDTWFGPDGKKSETYGQAIAVLVNARKPWDLSAKP